jgi:signal transduction histidine kinase/Fe-S-cluster-containing hydrogenase component 2
MNREDAVPLVTTIREKCRVCYTCVRECPAKAIRIEGGQAEVISGRCIGCGNCVRVCSQHAKKVAGSIEDVNALLDSGKRVSACLAPSFPAEFTDIDYRNLVGMIRSLGFHLVNEVAFGADLVAARYRKLLEEDRKNRFIATSCPGIVEYVCRYHPDLISFLAPIVSPMLATARALKTLYGKDLKVVFIGPCIAKKAERDSGKEEVEIDAVLTFIELRQMLQDRGIEAQGASLSEFDPPHSRYGALFPVTRGMLQAAGISDDLMPGNVLAADGRTDFVEAIREFESGDLDVKLLEVLCCSGCIMGPGISNGTPLFSRRSRVLNHVRRRLALLPEAPWREQIALLADLDLSRTFVINDQRVPEPSDEDIRNVLGRMGKTSQSDELNCGACGYDTCRDHAVAICSGAAESEMCLPYAIEQLRKTLEELASSHQQLELVQEALVQSEKLASMGQLAAGIAHEINNPLGIVLMYAHLMLEEYRSNLKLSQDLNMIAEQTDRCKKIVSGLLDFARQNKVTRQPTDLCGLIERVLKSLCVPANVKIEIFHHTKDPIAEVDADQVAQVLVNLIVNAIEAMPEGGRLTLTTRDKDRDHICFAVNDTGSGIDPENLSKIFEPFFTTKKLGKGTGLGLAVAYGIVKMHRGEITVKSSTDPKKGPRGTSFCVTLPRQEQLN